MKLGNRWLVLPLNSLRQGENTCQGEVDARGMKLGNYTFLAPLRCFIVCKRTGNRVEVGVDVRTEIRLICSRCGEPARVPIRGSWEVTFLPELAKEEDEDIEELGEATDLEFYTGELDLRPVVRDVFILSVPIAPLCKSDCLGICPVCGLNRNRFKCDCQPRMKPSPFEQLRRFVDE